jgi:hypothetical protein
MVAANGQSICPGCGLEMPVNKTATYSGYYNVSPECWDVYAEVLGFQYSNISLVGQVHQITVDTYAVQHPGGTHPDKSIAIHLSGLHLVFEGGSQPTIVPRLLKRLADTVQTWPHFPPPAELGPLTIFEIALATSHNDHINTARKWAGTVWNAWAAYHAEIADLVKRHLSPPP